MLHGKRLLVAPYVGSRHLFRGIAARRDVVAGRSGQRAGREQVTGTAMKITVTSQNRHSVTDHAGVCRKFWVFDTNSDQIISRQLVELAKDQSFHAANPHAPHPLDGVSVLITRGMGAGLARRLAKRGIESIVTKETEPERAAAAYVNGTLERETAMCSGHRHRHGHG